MSTTPRIGVSPTFALALVLVSATVVLATSVLVPVACASAGSPLGSKPRAGGIVFDIGSSVYRADRNWVTMDAAAFLSGGRAFVPMRYLGDAMGAEVAWDARTRRVTLTRGTTCVELTVGRPVIRVNGREQAIDVSPVLVGGRTYLPARFVAEAFGYGASWDPSLRRVTLRYRYAYSRDWLDRQSIWVFAQPPLDYLAEVQATGTLWSCYFAGWNEWDQFYLDSLHANSYIVVSNFPTAQGTTNLGVDQDFARRTACLDVHGRQVDFGCGIPIYLACHNNPEWRAFLESRVRENVGGGADAILIDETAGNASRLDIACFCPYCLEGFRQYLKARFSAAELRNRLGIQDVFTYDYAAYLRSVGAECAASDPRADLRREFFRFQFQTRLEHLRDLEETAREHVRGRSGTAGEALAWCANLYNLTPVQQLFIDLVDLVPFEMPIERLPEGKCVPTYALGRAAAPGKVLVGFPDIFVLAQHSPEDNVLWSHWLCEAWAAGVTFLLPYEAFTAGGGSFTLPAEAISETTDFLRSHIDLYRGTEPTARVAILYDLGAALYDWEDPTATGFYRIGRALYEAHIPYEVVWTGDDDLAPRSVTVEELQRYGLVLVPRRHGVTGSAAAALSAYQARGGRVMRDVTDATAVGTVRGSGLDVGLETDAPPQVGVLAWKKGTSLVVHLVNYDYDYGRHSFKPQGAFNVTVTLPPGVSLEGRILKLHRPGGPAEVVPFSLAGGKVSFVVPVGLEVYAVAAFE